MSNDFDVQFEAPSTCCGDALEWTWDSTELKFHAECSCMRRYHLQPLTCLLELDDEGFEDYDD